MQSSLKPEEDFLDEDKPFKQMVKKQHYCVLSMLTPNSFPENKRDQYKDQKILGIKVRGVFETYEDAKSRSEQLQKIDKHHNIFVGEVGKWLPFNVDIATMETEDDPVYREQALNQYMKAYKDCLKEEEVEEKERKEQTLKANNAKVVTGEQKIASEFTGLGNPIISSPGTLSTDKVNSNDLAVEKEKETDNDNYTEEILEQQTQKIEELKSNSNDKIEDIDNIIKSSQDEKNKIVIELEDSKNNLKELESKLSVINQMYTELNK